MITVELRGDRALMVRLDEAARNVESAFTRGIRAAAIYLASAIKKHYLSGDPVHRRTGNLSRAVFSEMTGPTSARVAIGSEAPYARYVNDGTRPHVIEAKNGKALAIPNTYAHAIGLNLRREAAAEFGVGVGSQAAWNYAYQTSSRALQGASLEKFVFVRRVMHPGTQPTHFMERALKENTERLRDIVAESVRRAVKNQQPMTQEPTNG